MPDLTTFTIGDVVDYNGPGDFTLNPAGLYVVAGGGVALLRVSVVAEVTQYTHVQTVPATLWSVPHNLAADVDSVNVYVNDQLVQADVNRIDMNNLTVEFALPQVGEVIVEN